MKKSSIIRILTAALVLTACGGEAKQNINPEVPVKSGDWFSVSASSGDTIEKEDISLEIAKGTFGQDVKIAITEVKKGSVMGNDEQSPFYQITVDEKGTKKPIVVKIRYAGDPDEVQAVIKMPTYSFHESKFVCEPFPINSSAGDGFISVTIPEMNPAKGPSPYFTIGLIKNTVPPTTKTPDTKAQKYPLLIMLYTDVPYDYISSLHNVLLRMLPKSFDALTSANMKANFNTLGIKICKFSEKEKDLFGKANPNILCKDLGYLSLNATKINEMIKIGFKQNDLIELQQTITHEIFHVVHNCLFDPRYGAQINWQGWWGSEWSMLGEAIGTWTEKFCGINTMGDNIKAHGTKFLTHFLPASNSASAYMENGYGMGLFIEYLSKKSSDAKISKILEYQRDGAESLQAALEKFCNANSIGFFEQEGYMKFVKMALDGELDSDYTAVMAWKSDCYDDVAKITKAELKRIRGEVYNYGVKMNFLEMDEKFLSGIQDRDIVIGQKEADIVTYVYYITNSQQLRELGRATYSNEYSIPVKTFLGYKTKFPIVLVSTRKNPVYGPGKYDCVATVDFPKPDKNAPKIHELKFSFQLENRTDAGDSGYCPEFTWSTSYDDVMSAISSGSGVNISCYHKSSSATDDQASIEFKIDSYSKGKVGSISSIVFDYTRPYSDGEDKWHVEISNLPVEENSVDLFNSSEALWKAQGSKLKVKLTHKDKYGDVYKYVEKSSNYAKVYMEYKP